MAGAVQLRFVVLEHIGTATYKPGLHWDLLLETGTMLVAWELATWPEPGATVRATSLADHRLFYLDYEGEIIGGRGTVRRVDAGRYNQITADSGRYEYALNGGRLCGRIVIELEAADQEWTLRYFAGEGTTAAG